jgi:hypothetical protein
MPIALDWQPHQLTGALRPRYIAALPYPMDGARNARLECTDCEWAVTLHETGRRIGGHFELSLAMRLAKLWLADRVMHDANNEHHPAACRLIDEL